MATFSIAGLQLEIARGDNLATMRTEIEAVVARFPWVQMVVLGELSAYGSGTARAESLAGPTEQEFCRIARALRIWLVPGSFYVREGESVFNLSPVINPAGEVVARHRKMFPFLPYETGVASGKDFIVFDVPDVGRFGISNCYDMWFPDTTRMLAAMGAAAAALLLGQDNYALLISVSLIGLVVCGLAVIVPARLLDAGRARPAIAISSIA